MYAIKFNLTKNLYSILYKDISANNTLWNKIDQSYLSSSFTKGNRLIIKELKEKDLNNFECKSEIDHLILHKRLDLNQTEFNDSLVKITRLTDMIKVPPNEIRTKLKTYENLFEINILGLTELNIHSQYLPASNEIKLKCVTSSGIH